MKKHEKIVAFGEIMLRLTPPDYTTISQARNFIANYGGGEANVLVSLSHLGHFVKGLFTMCPQSLHFELGILNVK